MTTFTKNADPHEIAKFDALAARWWDPTSEFKPLHEINPLRLEFIDQRAQLKGKKVLDIGCGGGILTEAMAGLGAEVMGIDLSEAPLAVAKLHLKESGYRVTYQKIAAEELAQAQPATFDVVTCMEMLEHVPDPASIIQACATLVKPGGHVFFSTLNRNPKSWLLAIVGAEYILRLLPRGTHEYMKFIKPSELDRWIRQAHLKTKEFMGIHYQPFTQQYSLGPGIDVNYLAYVTRPSVDA